ncbi:kinase-like protein [Trametes maxima]|nr:kinase-like protein [Trametes maxima]
MFLTVIIEAYLALRKRIAGRKFYGRIVELPFGLVLKISPSEGASEGDIIRFVQRHTTIPTPQVIASTEGRGTRYLIMKRTPGTMLERTWGTLSANDRSNVVAQLRSFLSQLRALPTPHGRAICGLHGASLRDGRFASSDTVGPFPDEDAFNARLVQTSARFVPESALAGVRPRMRVDHAVVFTHGGVAPCNIIVDGDNKVVALLDWETAGWYPEHWEWVKAMWCPPEPRSAGEMWREAVPHMFDQDYTVDWKVDCELSDRIAGAY